MDGDVIVIIGVRRVMTIRVVGVDEAVMMVADVLVLAQDDIIVLTTIVTMMGTIVIVVVVEVEVEVDNLVGGEVVVLEMVLVRVALLQNIMDVGDDDEVMTLCH